MERHVYRWTSTMQTHSACWSSAKRHDLRLIKMQLVLTLKISHSLTMKDISLFPFYIANITQELYLKHHSKLYIK
jgi:hypothetical protein